MSIAENRKAFHDYFIEEKYEAGIVLEGWEVKAIRENRVNIKEAYVIIQRGEIYLIGCHVTPLGAASTHVRPDAIRTRKLLLHNEEIAKLIGKVERAGYTLVPLDMHYKNGRIKVQIGLAKGKKQYDKREAEKEKDWKRHQSAVMKAHNKKAWLRLRWRLTREARLSDSGRSHNPFAEKKKDWKRHQSAVMKAHNKKV